jgi:ketosteroid isomerase-like protein
LLGWPPAAILILVAKKNADAVRRFWDLFNTQGVDAAVDDLACYADPNVEFHEDPAFPEGGIYRGLEEIRGYVTGFQEHMAGHRMELEELREVGDSVLAFLHEQATGAQSGVAVELRPCFVFSFEAGRLTRIDAYLDRDRALATVGLKE